MRDKVQSTSVGLCSNRETSPALGAHTALPTVSTRAGRVPLAPLGARQGIKHNNVVNIAVIGFEDVETCTFPETEIRSRKIKGFQ